MEPNCHVFDVCVDPGRPERFLLYERYADAEEFDAHLATDHFLAFDKEVESIIVSKSVQIWDSAVGSLRRQLPGPCKAHPWKTPARIEAANICS